MWEFCPVTPLHTVVFACPRMALNYFTITSKSAHRWKYSQRRKDVAAAVPGGRIKESAAATAAATTSGVQGAPCRSVNHSHPERSEAKSKYPAAVSLSLRIGIPRLRSG